MVSGVIYGLVAASVVCAAVLSAPASQSPGPVPMAPVQPEWRHAYAARFPGCVNLERWSESEAPGSVVVVRRSGEVARMPLDEARARSRSDAVADDVWTVGACR